VFPNDFDRCLLRTVVLHCDDDYDELMTIMMMMMMMTCGACLFAFKSSLDNGELLVSLCYKPHLERLAVGIYECKNLNKLDVYAPPGKHAVFMLHLCVE